MTNRFKVLDETVSGLNQAGERLAATHRKVTPLFPLSGEKFLAMDDNIRERLDAYSIRYARCQDLLYPSMRALARAQLEPKADATFLELFALMEKQGIVDSVADWDRQRGLRNAIGHEYPGAENIVDILNGIYQASTEIQTYIDNILAKSKATNH